jgi:hypothetical protein
VKIPYLTPVMTTSSCPTIARLVVVPRGNSSSAVGLTAYTLSCAATAHVPKP